MSTGQMDNNTYDVIFVARKNAENKHAGMIAENVDKATAIRFAQRYCHRNEDNSQSEEQTLDSATPQSIDSDELITVPEAWESGYKARNFFRAVFVLQCVYCGG